MRALIISHAHPTFSIGGAELAAYNLFTALKISPDVDRVVFLARTDSDAILANGITMFKKDEYLWRQDMGSWFRLTSGRPTSIYREFREFLRRMTPDVVYVQHFAHIGIEMLAELRSSLPSAYLVVTFHEMLAICNRNGQMVKNGSKRLCHRESPEECSVCFPEHTPADFWLRKHYIVSLFEFVDHFVTPSEFVRQKYIEWGIDQRRISVIENGHPTMERADLCEVSPMLFGYFGQITEYKGVDTLLEAVTLLTPETQSKITVEVHGANLDIQGQWFQDHIERLSRPLLESGVLRWVGAYDQNDLSRRMKRLGWVIVPSIWWENSPMVIQEAFGHGIPVICSGIGGMAEKVRSGVDGIHFEARNPTDLARVLEMVARNPQLRESLAANSLPALTLRESADRYIALVPSRRPSNLVLGASESPV